MLSQAHRLLVDMGLQSKADQPFDCSSPSALGYLDALKTQILIHALFNTPLLVVEDPFGGLDGPEDQSELVRVLDHVARTYRTMVVLVLSFNRLRVRVPSLFGLARNLLAMGRDGRTIFSGSVTHMIAFMSETSSTSNIVAEKLNTDRRYLNDDGEYLDAVLLRLTESTKDHCPDTDEHPDDDISSDDGLSMRLLRGEDGVIQSNTTDLSEILCDSFKSSSFRRSSLQTIGRFDRTQARELRTHQAHNWMELCILLSRTLHVRLINIFVLSSFIDGE